MVQQQKVALPPPLLPPPAVPLPLGDGRPMGTPPPPYRAQVDPDVDEPLVPGPQLEEPAVQVNKFLYLKLVAFYTYSVLHFSLPYVV